ncbi:MAG TPA: DUF4290 domain-containing protein [Candidatus Avibacteroides faecavium]|nr:DUF4290 domain-containing protein [Candidatus Avibacteroides faecavium]
MKYNTEEKKLPLPEYGRSIQNMVDHALTITDRAERQRCANTIIAIMGNMNTQLRDIPDFKHKLWDHLAIMSNFQLDIDYPYEIIPKDNLTSRPGKVPYPQHKIMFMHYGYNIQEMIKKASAMPEGEARKNLIDLLANMMKKDYYAWAKDIADESKIIKDLFAMSNGAIDLKPGDITFFEAKNHAKRNNKKMPKKGH